MALTHKYCTTMGKIVPLFGPRFPHLTNIGNDLGDDQGPTHSSVEGQHPYPKLPVRPFSGLSPSQLTP